MHFLTSVSIGSRTKNQLSPTWISKIQLDLKQSTAHAVKVFTLFKTIITMLDSRHCFHCYHRSFCSFPLLEYQMVWHWQREVQIWYYRDNDFCRLPPLWKNIERNCAPWNFFIACVPFQKFYHCSSLAICVERKGKMAIRLYGPWSRRLYSYLLVGETTW